MSVRVVYEDVAVGAADASTVTTTAKKDFANPALLPYGTDAGLLASCEQNQWVLDGTRVLLGNQRAAFWSAVQSNDDCTFDAAPTITISLNGQFSSPGIFFYFDGSEGDYCSEIVLTWYNGEEQLATRTFAPNSYKYFCEQQVDLYNKLVVQINKTHLPNHYAKISQIFFGIVREFERAELRSVRVTEGLNIISDDLEINTLDFSLDSADDIDYVFQQKQPVSAYDSDHLIGVFYIESSSRKSVSVYDISCIDALGVMDSEPFAAAIYSGASAKTLIQTILAGHFTLEYDSSLDDAKVTGYIPDCTKREALQQIAFSICATIDTSGTRGIKVRKLTSDEAAEIPLDRLYTGGSVETSSPVTEVRVTAHAYKTTGSGDSVEVDGTTYYHTTTVTTKANPKVTATTKPNVVEVRDATLVNSSNVAAVTQHVYDYYMRRQTHSVRIVMDGETPGDYVKTTTPWGSTITGTITSMSILLSGIAAAECKIIGT